MRKGVTASERGGGKKSESAVDLLGARKQAII